MEISLKLLKIQNEWWETGSLKFDASLLAYENSPLRFRPKLLDEIALRAGEATIIEGARGVGKTTAMKMLIDSLIERENVDPQNIFYYSCHNLNSKEQLNELIKAFINWQRGGGSSGMLYMFIDEIALVDGWLEGLEYLAEAGVLGKACLLLSSSIRLPAGVGKIGHLALRRSSLSSVSFREFIGLMDGEVFDELERDGSGFSRHRKRLEYLLDVYLLTGGYISAMNSFVRYGQVAQEIYDSYLNWIMMDVARTGRDLVLMRQIAEGIIANQGIPLGFKTLGKKTKAQTHNTVSDYVRILQSMFIVQALYQYDEEKKINRSANKKFYFRDIFSFWAFSAQLFGSLNFWQFSRAYIHDKNIFPILLENLVFSHLLKEEKSEAWEESVAFWRDKRRKDEISFVRLKDGEACPVKLLYDDEAQEGGEGVFERAGFGKGAIISRNIRDSRRAVEIVPLIEFLFKRAK